MRSLTNLIERNRAWAARIKAQDPEFFQKLSAQQSPQYLWIGCSDSRVPANEIVGMSPGELFVHRNVANVVVHTDLNCLSAVQYAVEALNVQHIIVCGHYGCGGVRAALLNLKLGLIDNWLRHIQDVGQKHAKLLAEIEDEAERVDKLCELNIIEQVLNVCQTTVVQNAWESGKALIVHGWVYDLGDGLVRDLSVHIASQHEVASVYANAVAELSKTKHKLFERTA